MAANPEEAANVRATNRSYVFFRITGLSTRRRRGGAIDPATGARRSIAKFYRSLSQMRDEASCITLLAPTTKSWGGH
jgi:hypothetical protein